VAVSGAPYLGELIRLLADQREALLLGGPAAADEIEMRSQGLQKALTALAAASRPAASVIGNGAAADAGRPSPAELARLQDELQATQATLFRLAAGNRRALDALFGEASLYSR